MILWNKKSSVFFFHFSSPLMWLLWLRFSLVVTIRIVRVGIKGGFFSNEVFANVSFAFGDLNWIVFSFFSFFLPSRSQQQHMKQVSQVDKVR